MSTKQPTPKYCPVCGALLVRNRQSQSYCQNRQCGAFGVIVSLVVEQAEIKLDIDPADNEKLSLSYRQLLILLDSLAITKNPSIDLFGAIQRTSEHFIESVTDALKLRAEVVNGLPDCPAKTMALGALDQLANILLDKQSSALLVNTVSTEAIYNAYTRLALCEQLQSKNRRVNELLRTLKTMDEEGYAVGA